MEANRREESLNFYWPQFENCIDCKIMKKDNLFYFDQMS